MEYRILCTRKSEVPTPRRHGHIVSVGTGTTPQQYSQTWTVAQVLAAIGRGDLFYTQSVSTGKVAKVEPYTCHICSRQGIRTTADAVKDNNLDDLPLCG